MRPKPQDVPVACELDKPVVSGTSNSVVPQFTTTMAPDLPQCMAPKMAEPVVYDVEAAPIKSVGKADTVFPYEAFWAEKIESKKRDHSYRVFRSVERSASEFPYAKVSF